MATAYASLNKTETTREELAALSAANDTKSEAASVSPPKKPNPLAAKLAGYSRELIWPADRHSRLRGSLGRAGAAGGYFARLAARAGGSRGAGRRTL